MKYWYFSAVTLGNVLCAVGKKRVFFKSLSFPMWWESCADFISDISTVILLFYRLCLPLMSCVFILQSFIPPRFSVRSFSTAVGNSCTVTAHYSTVEQLLTLHPNIQRFLLSVALGNTHWTIPGLYSTEKS